MKPPDELPIDELGAPAGAASSAAHQAARDDWRPPWLEFGDGQGARTSRRRVFARGHGTLSSSSAGAPRPPGTRGSRAGTPVSRTGEGTPRRSPSGRPALQVGHSFWFPWYAKNPSEQRLQVFILGHLAQEATGTRQP